MFEQAGVDRLFGGLVHGAGGLISKYPSWFFQEHTGDGQALLLAARQGLSPGRDIVQAFDQIG